MMAMYTVVLKGQGDYGETHFNVFADSLREAWSKACEMEDRWNIENVYFSRRIER